MGTAFRWSPFGLFRFDQRHDGLNVPELAVEIGLDSLWPFARHFARPWIAP
jgi:hypothetical protein